MRLGQQILRGVLHIPSSSVTLISAAQLLKQFGGKIVLGKCGAILQRPACKPMLLASPDSNGLMRVKAHIMFLSAANQLKREKIDRLHRKLGHCSKNKMRLVLAHRSIDGLKPADVKLMTMCSTSQEM